MHTLHDKFVLEPGHIEDIERDEAIRRRDAQGKARAREVKLSFVLKEDKPLNPLDELLKGVEP